MQLQNILVPLDGSAFAEHALPFAATLAERANACLRLVSVEPRLLVAGPEEEIPAHLALAHADDCARVKAYLESIEERIRAPRLVRTTSRVLDGVPVEGILEAVSDLSADLVVMTTHGRGGVKRAWLGSVADQLVRRCPVPVLLLRPDEVVEADLMAHADIAAILVPLDGSEFAQAALEPALAIARLHRTTLTLLHVVPTPYAVLPGPVPFAVVNHVDYVNRTAAAEKYLHQIAEAVRAEGIEASTIVAHEGPVAEVIIRHALGDPSQMIAMSTHGRGGVGRLLLGSIADKVLRGAGCPVLMVHPAAVAAPERAEVALEAVPAR